MKIIYLHQYFNTPDMSGGTRSFEMARFLVRKGHEVHIITSWVKDTHKKDWFITEEHGIKVHWFPIPYSNEMGFIKRIRAFVHFAIKASFRATNIKANLIFATSTPLTIALPAIYASKKQNIPMVFEVRDLWPKIPIAMGILKSPITKWAAKTLEKWAYKNSSAIVALSPGMKDGIAQCGYPASKITVIPNGSDINFFSINPDLGTEFRKKRPWLSEKPLLVYGGTFGLINGVEYMVDIARTLKETHSDIIVLLVGKGRTLDYVKNKAIEAKVLNINLFIENELKKKDMPSLLNAASIVTSLTIDKKELFANSANKFFDGLAAGKPIMINYAGWQKKLLESSGAGFSTWGLSTEQAAHKITQHINNKIWVDNAKQSSLKLAKNEFSREKLALELEEVFKFVLERESKKKS